MANKEGNSGNNMLAGTAEDDTIDGRGGNDNLKGLEGNDRLYGGDGNDLLDGGPGRDTASYGSGYGQSGLHGYGVGVTIDLSATPDANGYINGADGDKLKNIENLSGTGFGDHLTGDDNRNTLNGFQGDDLLDGGGGDDSLLGGDGNDRLYGYDGDDQLYGWDGDDQLYGGDGNDRLNGEGDDDLLYGGDGDDWLDGGLGDDRLDGGGGDDNLLGRRGDDVFVFGADSGHDTIEDFELDFDKIQFSEAGITFIDLRIEANGGSARVSWGDAGQSITLTDVADTDLTESAFLFSGDTQPDADTPTGTAGDDTLSGTAGDDTLNGLAGDDMLSGMSNNVDRIAEYLTDGFFKQIDEERRSFDVQPGGTLTANITALNEDGQELARWAVDAWTNVSGINFSIVTTDDADLVFTDDEAGAYSRSTASNGTILTSKVNIPASLITQYGNETGSKTFQTYLHEVGHALGLGHPGSYPRDSENSTLLSYWFDARFPNDSYQVSVMSYFTQTENTYINASFAYPVTPMIADIVAIHKLYGAPADINEGNTVYGYGANMGGYLQQFFEQWTARAEEPGTDRPLNEATTSPSGGDPFVEQSTNPFGAIDVTFDSAPAFADLDNDGDLDLVLGNNWFLNDSGLLYFENTGDMTSPDFIERTGSANPFNSLALNDESAPALADLDGDNDLDLVVGDENGTLSYFENTGSIASAAFTQRELLEGIDAGDRSRPVLIDLDNDNDFDLVVGTMQGNLRYFENTGTPAAPNFSEQGGDDNPFNHINLDEDSAPALADVDYDGDPDLIIGYSPEGVFDADTLHYENIGTATQPRFTAAPTYSLDMSGFSSVPTLADIDGDGDFDLVVGDDFGKLKYYKNSPVNSGDNIATLTIYDTGGYDVLDLRTDTRNQRIDLRPEGISDVYGEVGNLVIGRDTMIEVIIAGSGDDMIRGNDGPNRMLGRAGDDVLMGGEGKDRFAFYADEGHDTILDFTKGEDKIDLRPIAGIESITDLTGTDTSNGLVIYLDDNQNASITLPGFERTDLTADDFIFAA